MTLADGLRLLMRILHTGTLAVWLGGGVLYLLARATLRPVVNRASWGLFTQPWRALSRRCFWILVASGVYLVFDRLTNTQIGIMYIVVLGIKLAVVAAIAWIVSPRSRGQLSKPAAYLRVDQGWLLLGLGGAALVLGVVLTLLYEGAQRNL